MVKQALIIHLSKIEHRNEFRIKVALEKRADLITKIKGIQGRRWSKTKNCWHVPYDNISFQALEKVFGKENLYFEEKKIGKTVKKNIPIGGIEKGKIIPQIKDYASRGEIRKKFVGKKILIQQLNKKWVKVYVPQDKKGWGEVIRNINGRRWNAEKTYWAIPYVKSSFYTIKKFIGLKNINLDLVINKDIPDAFSIPIKKSNSTKNKKSKHWDQLNDIQKKAIQDTEEYLTLKQYSPTTIKSYCNHLIAILIFHNKVLPEKIENKEIQTYLLHQIKFKKISASTQNVIINAYKLYVEKILGRPRTYVEVPRPKKPKKLPNVLSKEEIVDLIESVSNIKHKFILLLIYSSGLRLGEITNLRLRDINLKRRNIFIHQGKGKKDRYVLLAETAMTFFHTYKKQYAPSYWLFEGATGGQYSKRSVQAIFTKAKEKSKINPFATVHTLRHSYATHCVENGFNIKLIQEALGHNSIKTTELYLHLAADHLIKLSSPIDNLKISKDSLS